MSFHPRNKNLLARNSSTKNIFLPIAVVILFIVIFSFSWTRNVLFTIGSPFWFAKNATVYFFSSNIGILNSKTNLLKDNYFLNAQIKSEEKNRALFNLLKSENEDLKNILNRKSTDQKLLLSSVLVKPFLSAYDTLIIDVGQTDNVKINDQILADGNVVIGYVAEVYDKTSKVVLYSSPGEKVKVLIGTNNIEKEATGLGGGNFSVQIPREIDVKEGDSIIIPSISINIFGVVEKVEFKESDAFQNILFKSPTNISELKWVEVLLSNKK